MSGIEHPMEALREYLPEGSFEGVVEYIHKYRVHLTVTRARKSVLGDYRHPVMGKNHRITVNGNLNKFEFLITLLHEIAHLLTFDQYGNKVDSHGQEWKKEYSSLLVTFVRNSIFPPDIVQVLRKSIASPSATANGETELLSVLRKYDENRKPGWVMIQDLPPHSKFRTPDGRVFKIIGKLRKRYRATEVRTGNGYLFNPIYEVYFLEGE